MSGKRRRAADGAGGIVDGYCGHDFEGTSEELTGHTLPVFSVCALGDGRLVSGSWDNT